MPDLDIFAILQFAGMGVTLLAAITAWFWVIRQSKGTDRDMLLMLLLVGGFIFMTLIQFILLMVRLG